MIHRLLRTTCPRCAARMALTVDDMEICLNGHSADVLPAPKITSNDYKAFSGKRGNVYYRQAGFARPAAATVGGGRPHLNY
ncbi:MAG: hypothetical protein OXF79_12100 [Chloroflexi bacterium]|nr:hypothetical protein [Chloroflexota bacterium]